MTQLANLQTLFQSNVVAGDAEAVPEFVGDENASAEERLGVYYEAYRLRLLEALQIDFPGLVALTTEEEFTALGLRYIDTHPSRHPSVRYFGREIAGFLAADENNERQPYLAEMARFEWARGLAFDAEDAALMRLEDFAAISGEDWPELTVKFNPALQRIRAEWNTGPIWRAVNADEPLPEPVRLETPETLAVWRRGISLYWRSMDDIETSAIDLFAEGDDFAGVCDGLCARLDAEAVPARMATLLNQWATEGLLAKA